MDKPKHNVTISPGYYAYISTYIRHRLYPWIQSSLNPSVLIAFLSYRAVEFSIVILALFVLQWVFPQSLGELWVRKNLWIMGVGIILIGVWSFLQAFLHWLTSLGIFWWRWCWLHCTNQARSQNYGNFLKYVSGNIQEKVNKAEQLVLFKYRRQQRRYKQWWRDYAEYNDELQRLDHCDISAVCKFIDRFTQDFSKREFTCQAILNSMTQLVTNQKQYDQGTRFWEKTCQIFAQLGRMQEPSFQPFRSLRRHMKKIESGLYKDFPQYLQKQCLGLLREVLVITSLWYQGWRLVAVKKRAQGDGYFSLLQQGGRLLLRTWNNENKCENREYSRHKQELDSEFYGRIVREVFPTQEGETLAQWLEDRSSNGEYSDSKILLNREWSEHTNYEWQIGFNLQNARKTYATARVYHALLSDKNSYDLAIKKQFQRNDCSDAEVRFIGLQILQHSFFVFQDYLQAKNPSGGKSLLTELNHLTTLVKQNMPFDVRYAYKNLCRKAQKYTPYTQSKFFEDITIDKVIERLVGEVHNLLSFKLLDSSYTSNDGSWPDFELLIPDVIKIGIHDILPRIVQFPASDTENSLIEKGAGDEMSRI